MKEQNNSQIKKSQYPFLVENVNQFLYYYKIGLIHF